MLILSFKLVLVCLSKRETAYYSLPFLIDSFRLLFYTLFGTSVLREYLTGGTPLFEGSLALTS